MTASWVLVILSVCAAVAAKRDDGNVQGRNRASADSNDAGVLSNVLEKLPLGGSDGALLGGLKSDEEGVIERIVDGVLHRNDDKDEYQGYQGSGSGYQREPYQNSGYGGGIGAQYPPQGYNPPVELDKKAQKEQNKLARQQNIANKKESRKYNKQINVAGHRRLQETDCEGDDCGIDTTNFVSETFSNEIKKMPTYEATHFKTHDTDPTHSVTNTSTVKKSKKKNKSSNRAYKKRQQQVQCLSTYEDVFDALVDAYGEDELVFQFEECAFRTDPVQVSHRHANYNNDEEFNNDGSQRGHSERNKRRGGTGSGRHLQDQFNSVMHYSQQPTYDASQDNYNLDYDSAYSHDDGRRIGKRKGATDAYAYPDTYSSEYAYEPAFENTLQGGGKTRLGGEGGGRRQDGGRLRIREGDTDTYEYGDEKNRNRRQRHETYDSNTQGEDHKHFGRQENRALHRQRETRPTQGFDDKAFVSGGERQKFMLPKRPQRSNDAGFEFRDRRKQSVLENERELLAGFRDNKDDQHRRGDGSRRSERKSAKFSNRIEMEDAMDNDHNYERMLLDPFAKLTEVRSTNQDRLNENAILLNSQVELSDHLVGFSDSTSFETEAKPKRESARGGRDRQGTAKLLESRAGAGALGAGGPKQMNGRSKVDSKRAQQKPKASRKDSTRNQQEMTLVTEDQWREHFGSMMGASQGPADRTLNSETTAGQGTADTQVNTNTKKMLRNN